MKLNCGCIIMDTEDYITVLDPCPDHIAKISHLLANTFMNQKIDRATGRPATQEDVAALESQINDALWGRGEE